MMKRKTLQVRFALWISGLLLLILGFFGTYVYAGMARGLSATIDNSLILNASQVAAGLNVDNGKLILSDSLMEAPENADLRGRGFTIRILTPEGKPIQEFGLYRGLPVPLNQSFTTYQDRASNINVRIYNQDVYDNNEFVAIVQVAQSLHDMQNTLQRLFVILLVSIPLLVTIAGISGYFLAAHTLAPIDQITLTARRISAEDLSARLNIPVTNDEVGRLTQTLNDMLARLDDSFQRERQFTNDASHELRTPLTAMQAILGIVKEKYRTPEEYRQALHDLAEETDRLQTLVENLLRLARGEKQSRNPHEIINLSTLLEDVVDSLRPLAETKRLAFTCETPEDLAMLGDSDELIRLFVNLLDNAIKYTEHGKITVTAQKDEKDITVNIADTGIGISPEHLPHIFDRFYQVDESRAMHGTGLGLAIAMEIACAHGGTIDVQSIAGKGTTFAIRLPIRVA